MKPCPYCAESIQDAAAKCRYCGEWLDPSRRPAWSAASETSPASATDVAPQSVPRSAPQVPTPPATRANPRSSTPGSPVTLLGAPSTLSAVESPSRASLPVGWSAPSWMAERAASAPDPLADPESAAAAPRDRRDGRSSAAPALEEASANFGVVADTTAADASQASRAALEEVAARMQQIKSSAAAVRAAMQDDAARRPQATAQAGEFDAPPASTEGEPPPGDTDDGSGEQHDVDLGDDDDDLDRLSKTGSKVSSAFEAGFLGDDDDLEDDDLHEDDRDDDPGFADLEPPPRGRGWAAMLAGAVVIVGVASYLVTGYIKNRRHAAVTDAEPITDDEPPPEVRAGSVAPPSPDAERPATPGEGRPLAPESPQSPPETAGGPLGLHPTLPVVTDPQTQAQLDEARSLYERGGKTRVADAETILRDVLTRSPNLPHALVLMSVVQLERGEHDLAHQTATRCTLIAPQEPDCWLVLGALGEDRFRDRDRELEEREQQRLAAMNAYRTYVDLAPEGRYAHDVEVAIRRLD